jgi:hypothetical protein
MRLEERVAAEKVFKHETQVMVATEAAGEGINLQFCHLMINYDIPWNPNRLEQRMGRIHRYGQQKDVYVFNLVADSTREGKVLSKLFDKLKEIRGAIGSEKVFDVIGETFYGKNLYQLILDAVANARSMDEIIKELDITVDETYIREVKEALGESLATRHIDYTKIKEMAEKAKEYRLIPEYVEEFFKRAFPKAGGKFRIQKDEFLMIDAIPYDLRKIAEEVDFKNRYGSILRSYPKVTFDKEIAFKNPDAEFVSFGHPLFEALLEWVKTAHFAKLQRGAVFHDPSGEYNGIFWFFEGEVKDGKGAIAGKRLMAIYDDGAVLKELNPAILWDFVPSENKEPQRAGMTRERAQEFAIDAVEGYKQEIAGERQRQAAIKRKYGVRSLEFLIGELDAELADLYERQVMGEKVDLAIRNKEERKRQYEEALKSLQKEIEQEASLTISMPKYQGAVLVKPMAPEEVSSREMKEIGRELVKQYERKQGREPTDVPDGYGYDLISRGKAEVRYIELKGFADEGDADLTPNEWFKARRFKEQYWLYVVAHAATSPILYLLNNPADNLKIEEKMEVVRFRVPRDEWKHKPDEVIPWA